MNSFSQDTTAAKKQTIILITTDFGNIKAVLYNETPMHRDNFIKMVKSGWYNGSIFHRVIKNFMIQGGMSGNGKEDPGYTIKAEIKPQFFHKRGALCAARTNNPQKASSGCNFILFTAERLMKHNWITCTVKAAISGLPNSVRFIKLLVALLT